MQNVVKCKTVFLERFYIFLNIVRFKGPLLTIDVHIEK